MAGPLDRWALDRLVPDHPLRAQHSSGALWVLNSAALAATGAADATEEGVERDADGVPTGRLWRLDRWLAAALPRRALDLAGVSADLAPLGVAGVTDADPHRTQADVDLFADAAAAATSASGSWS